MTTLFSCFERSVGTTWSYRDIYKPSQTWESDREEKTLTCSKKLKNWDNFGKFWQCITKIVAKFEVKKNIFQNKKSENLRKPFRSLHWSLRRIFYFFVRFFEYSNFKSHVLGGSSFSNFWQLLIFKLPRNFVWYFCFFDVTLHGKNLSRFGIEQAMRPPAYDQ